MRRFAKENSLGMVFGFLFLASLVGQAIAGRLAYNQEQLEHGGEAISLGRYLTSSDFGQAVMENWQSEYLQFLVFLLLTIWLFQKGSPESKKEDQLGLETEEEQLIGGAAKRGSPPPAKAGGWRAVLYGNSLLIVMALIFLGSWLAQSLTGWRAYNQEQLDHHSEAISWLGYLGNAEFWETTLQNWQSEFLAVGSFAVFTIFLRQRGSPESKPVGAAHTDTGLEG
jgi:membrane protein implicated in regulation of membrane protease activity